MTDNAGSIPAGSDLHFVKHWHRGHIDGFLIGSDIRHKRTVFVLLLFRPLIPLKNVRLVAR